ncbi:MAG: hypothetical protein IK092_01980 [Muribaculaceae bacterium]|nr:hypothetical protein [Muribaculaceae bacterium]
MKHIFLLLLVVVALACSRESNEESEKAEPKRVLITSVQPDDSVWVCNGSAAKRYHANDSCEGLLQCTKSIVPLTREEAEAKGRTWCQKCYREE